MPVSLHNFYSRATDTFRVLGFQNLRVENDKVFFAGNESSPEANRNAVVVFLKSLRAEHGESFADMLTNKHGLKEHQAQGKPLTRRMVVDLIREANEQKRLVREHNASMVEQFLTGAENGRPQTKNIAAALISFADAHKIPLEDLPEIKSRVEAFLRGKAQEGGFYPALLTLDLLLEGVGKGSPAYAGETAGTLGVALGSEGSALPGSKEDKLRLADLGLRADDSTFHRAAWQTVKMRQIQPQGALTRETIWQAVFNGENLPPDIASGQKAFSAAMEERSWQDMVDLASSSPRQPHEFGTALKFMPWSTVCELADKNNWGHISVTLGNAPGFSAAFDHMGSLETVTKTLHNDCYRAITKRPQGLPEDAKTPQPAFTFKLPDGKTETIQVGGAPNHGFDDDLDKAAYFGGRPNSLTNSLIERCRQICGPGASDEQLAAVVACLSQATLKPLGQASIMTGGELIDHITRASVSLSRGENGAVLAKFSTPGELGHFIGRFSMSLEIGADGKVTTREFELAPPRVVGGEMFSRMEAARKTAGPILDMDDPEGLLAAWKSFGALFPGANFSKSIIGRALGSLKESVIRSVNAEAAKSDANLTPARIREIRDAAVSGYLNDLEVLGKKADAYLQGFSETILTNEAKEAKRNGFIRACLEMGDLPRPEFVPAIMNMSGLVSTNIEALKGAGDWRQAEALMKNLYGSIKADFIQHEAFKGMGAGAFTAPLLVTMRMGLQELADRHSDLAFAEILTRHGGPYRDFLHGLTHHAPTFGTMAEHAFHPSLLLQQAMSRGGIINNATLEEQILARLNPYAIRERDLSVARQLELQGGVFITPGAQEVPPGLKQAIDSLPDALKNNKEIRQYYIGAIQKELNGLSALKKANTFLPRAMKDIKNRIANDVVGEMLNLKPYSGQGRPDFVASGLDNTFLVDFERTGVYVDGTYHHLNLTGTSPADFKNLFPDAYTAETLSTFANQNLAGIFMTTLNASLERQLGPEAAADFLQRVLRNYSLEDTGQDVRIDTLDRKSGLYRVTASYCKSTRSNFSGDALAPWQTASLGVERVVYELSVDVKLGPPVVGEGPRRHLPTVENVRVDFLIRGRDAVPGEGDDTPEAVKRALAEPPQTYMVGFDQEKNIKAQIKKHSKANKVKAQSGDQARVDLRNREVSQPSVPARSNV